MGWLITLVILTALAVLPLGVRIRYDASGPLVRLILGPVKLTVFPVKKKKEKKKADPKPVEKKAEEKLPEPPKPPKKAKKKTEETESKGGSLKDFVPFVKLGLNFLGDFRRKLRLDNLYLRLIMAGNDPCDLAVNYGRAWAAAGNLLPQLEKWFVIKKRDIEVECDFETSQTLIIAHLDLTITIGRLLSAVLKFAVRALIEYLKLRKKRKGGAVK